MNFDDDFWDYEKTSPSKVPPQFNLQDIPYQQPEFNSQDIPYQQPEFNSQDTPYQFEVNRNYDTSKNYNRILQDVHAVYESQKQVVFYKGMLCGVVFLCLIGWFWVSILSNFPLD